MRVLIAPDKFKGTLSATAAARAIARGWRRARPQDRLAFLPISDGGEGFGEVLRTALQARTLTTRTTDAAGNPRSAPWWWVASKRLAILEAAQSNGLALLDPPQRQPFQLDTQGVARLIQAALRKGARHCIIGVGGSATNDGGFGLAKGLGWSFFDKAGKPIERWTDLGYLHRLEPPAKPLPRCRFTVATDVENPLLGPKGATRVYGPQKGLGPEDLPIAEACLRRLASIVSITLHIDATTPGSGAAGGLGFGLRAFLGAERRLGFDVFAEFARLDRHLRTTDLVLTGEGSFDRQSAMGKGVGQWVRRCAEAHRPLLLLAGRITPGSVKLSESLPWARSLCDITSPDQALSRPAYWLEQLAMAAAKAWSAQSL